MSAVTNGRVEGAARATGPQRIALHSVIRDGHVDDYRETHARVPDDLLAAFARVGIHEWTIWRSGRRLFHLVVCDDFERAIAQLDADPVNADWQSRIGPFVELYRDASGATAFAPLEEVWDLADQRSGHAPS